MAENSFRNLTYPFQKSIQNWLYTKIRINWYTPLAYTYMKDDYYVDSIKILIYTSKKHLENLFVGVYEKEKKKQFN